MLQSAFKVQCLSAGPEYCPWITTALCPGALMLTAGGRCFCGNSCQLHTRTEGLWLQPGELCCSCSLT